MRVVFAVLLVSVAAGCSSNSSSKESNCRSGYNYCMDPGGNGVSLCCPTSSPYYCVNTKGCISASSSAFSSGVCGVKYFCSSEYN